MKSKNKEIQKISQHFNFKKMKSKKAMIFNISLVVITIVVLSTAFIAINNKIEKVKNQEPIGTKQYQLITTYQEAEKAQFYIEQSAKYHILEIKKQLIKKSGSIQNKEYIQNFTNFLEKKLNNSLSLYPYKNIIVPLLNNYEISFTEENTLLTAAAKEDMVLSHLYGEYHLNPSFIQDFSLCGDGVKEGNEECDDGIDDANELFITTNPFNPDTDGDGITDGEELSNGTNPISPN